MKNMKYQKDPTCQQAGQAIVMLLFFMVISITVITAVVIVVGNSISSGSYFERGTVAYYSAETGIENALLRLLRDPTYTGETMDIAGAQVTIVVDSGTITSTAFYANTERKIQVETIYDNNVLEVVSWREIN